MPFWREHLSPKFALHTYMSLVSKPNKDPLDYSKYGPIDLLNTDLQNFTKISDNCLSLWPPQLLHKDQVGFVPFWQGGDNTRRAIDLIEVALNNMRLHSYWALTQKRSSIVWAGPLCLKFCNRLDFQVPLSRPWEVCIRVQQQQSIFLMLYLNI